MCQLIADYGHIDMTSPAGKVQETRVRVVVVVMLVEVDVTVFVYQYMKDFRNLGALYGSERKLL